MESPFRAPCREYLVTPWDVFYPRERCAASLQTPPAEWMWPSLPAKLLLLAWQFPPGLAPALADVPAAAPVALVAPVVVVEPVVVLPETPTPPAPPPLTP